ncbi:MAG: hypothetical protein ACFNO3_06450, partial [Alloprevotella tannerae]
MQPFGRFGFFCPWSNRRAQSLFGRHRLRVLGVEKGVLLVAMVKCGCELAFETMVEAGIMPESAYYESLHEVPLIAN